jgi:uncharacterized protein YqjF (DUF2071 family)
MGTLVTVRGRDVLFAHWPVAPEAVERVVPDPLEVETFDGSAWVSVLALETRSVTPGDLSLPGGDWRGVPQLNLRTYVSAGGEAGVYFLSLDSDSRTAVTVGREVFGLPFSHARMRVTRRGEETTFRSRRTGGDGPPAVFGARYRPTGERYRADAGTLEATCVEQHRYYLSTPEGRRPALRRVDATDGAVSVGRIERDPWELRPVTASVRRNTLFAAAGLPAPSADPVVHYSPGFEMAVQSSTGRD